MTFHPIMPCHDTVSINIMCIMRFSWNELENCPMGAERLPHCRGVIKGTIHPNMTTLPGLCCDSGDVSETSGPQNTLGSPEEKLESEDSRSLLMLLLFLLGFSCRIVLLQIFQKNQ